MLTEYQSEWHQLYHAEEERILGALGKITDGGIVENIAHIGATSIVGMASRDMVDICLSVWPFPLPDDAVQQLTSIGYVIGQNEDELATNLPSPNDDSSGLRIPHDSGRFQRAGSRRTLYGGRASAGT